ncbi:TadE family type IV pilus minor pilin [Sinomonas humi]|uniref:TadE family type IV pilus minor pilin n=1 Tax=Sinomonas humi TaxID=1338436 RepID=UPI0018CEEED1|nr:TadE family type IV pilus minor pilin [Sinomonas humi]
MAVGVLAVVALLGVLLTALSAAIMQLQVEEAVRGAAREIARGESPETATALAKRIAGDAVIITVGVDGSTASVAARMQVPGPLAIVGGVVAQATASVRLESAP